MKSVIIYLHLRFHRIPTSEYTYSIRKMRNNAWQMVYNIRTDIGIDQRFMAF